MDQENSGESVALKAKANKAKKDELINLKRLHDTAIERQQNQINKAVKGKIISSTCPQHHIVALAKADHALLVSGRDKIVQEIEDLEKELTS